MFIYQRVLYLDVIQVGKLWLVTVAYGMTQLFDKPYCHRGFHIHLLTGMHVYMILHVPCSSSTVGCISNHIRSNLPIRNN